MFYETFLCFMFNQLGKNLIQCFGKDLDKIHVLDWNESKMK